MTGDRRVVVDFGGWAIGKDESAADSYFHGAAGPYPAEPAPEAPRRRVAVSAGRGDLRPSSVTSCCTTSSPTQSATWACHERHLNSNPPTHTTARSTSSLACFGALVDQLPGALLPTRLPSDALCL
eukprot:8916414-Pyramimonas_sp.AAC.1